MHYPSPLETDDFLNLLDCIQCLHSQPVSLQYGTYNNTYAWGSRRNQVLYTHFCKDITKPFYGNNIIKI